MRFNILLLLMTVSLVGCSRLESPKKADPKIVGKLQQIIELRERSLKEQQLLQELGKGGGQEFVMATVELAEARIALAKEHGKTEEMTKELRIVVKTLKDYSHRQALLAEEDRRTKTALGEIKIGLLEAEVRLLRAEAVK